MADTEESGFKIKDETGKEFRITEVMDSYGTVHTITKQLGQAGGQGIVFKTKNPKIVVKFLLGSRNNNDQMEEPFVYSKESSGKIFREKALKIKKIIEKPFLKNSHIAYPIARLEDYSGYVMLFMDEMCDFSDFVNRNKTKEVGGLRRKYDLLAKLSIILSKLHSVGMVYCDISSGNVFVTKNKKFENQNVWLIDPDNIYIPSMEQGGGAYTVQYAAPEIVNEEKACTCASDIYAFASLAFETVFTILPFAGKEAANFRGNDSPSPDDWDAEPSPDDWDAEPSPVKQEQKPKVDARYSGKSAWVLDANDDSNRVEGLTLENSKLYMTDSVYKLFELMFTAGKQNLNMRPPSFVWPKYLFEAKDLIINCNNKNCQHSFIFNTNMTHCPYCNEKLPNMIQIFNKDRLVFVHELNFKSSEQFYLPERLFFPFNIETGNNSYFKVYPKVVNGNNILEIQLFKQSINDKFFVLNKKLNIEKPLISIIRLELTKDDSFVLINKSLVKERQKKFNIIVK